MMCCETEDHNLNIKLGVNLMAEQHDQYTENTTRTQTLITIHLYYLNTVVVTTSEKAAQSASCDHDVCGERDSAINWKIKYALPEASCYCVPVHSIFCDDTQFQMSKNLII
jgi:hypothetical protein